MTFFDPADEFLAWLKAHAGDRPVFDVGCGNCKLLERMWAAGIRAMGIDKYAYEHDVPMETLQRVLAQDATRCPTLANHPGLVLFCRPNHTGWVADAVVKVHPDSEVLYVSKPGNQHVDLPRFTFEQLDAPGCRVEEVRRVLRPYPEFTEPNYFLAGAERLLAMYKGNPLVDG